MLAQGIYIYSGNGVEGANGKYTRSLVSENGSIGGRVWKKRKLPVLPGTFNGMATSLQRAITDRAGDL